MAIHVPEDRPESARPCEPSLQGARAFGSCPAPARRDGRHRRPRPHRHVLARGDGPPRPPALRRQLCPPSSLGLTSASRPARTPPLHEREGDEACLLYLYRLIDLQSSPVRRGAARAAHGGRAPGLRWLNALPCNSRSSRCLHEPPRTRGGAGGREHVVPQGDRRVPPQHRFLRLRRGLPPRPAGPRLDRVVRGARGRLRCRARCPQLVVGHLTVFDRTRAKADRSRVWLSERFGRDWPRAREYFARLWRRLTADPHDPGAGQVSPCTRAAGASVARAVVAESLLPARAELLRDARRSASARLDGAAWRSFSGRPSACSPASRPRRAMRRHSPRWGADGCATRALAGRQEGTVKG